MYVISPSSGWRIDFESMSELRSWLLDIIEKNCRNYYMYRHYNYEKHIFGVSSRREAQEILNGFLKDYSDEMACYLKFWLLAIIKYGPDEQVTLFF